MGTVPNFKNKKWGLSPFIKAVPIYSKPGPKLTKTGERIIFRENERQSVFFYFMYSIDLFLSLFFLKIHSISQHLFLCSNRRSRIPDQEKAKTGLHATVTRKRNRASRIKGKQNVEPASRAAADQMGDSVRTKTHFKLTRTYIFSQNDSIFWISRSHEMNS